MTLLKKLGPGLLFAGAAIGVSHLVQSTRAGADFGFGLIWALLLVHVCKYPFFQFGPRYAIATGESLLDGYLKLGKPILITYFVLNLATMFTIQTAVTIVTAGLAANLFGITSNPAIWSILITVICLLILLIGRFKLLDILMKIIIITLTISTIAAVILAYTKNTNTIPLTQIFPKETTDIAFLIAFMGWMPAPLDVTIWQSLWTLEKRKNTKNYNASNVITDFNIGYASTIVIGCLFIALGALVMFNSQENFSGNATIFSAQLIQMYTQSLGQYTHFIIAIAAFTTMFSTTITTLDASPRAMSYSSKLLMGKQIKYSYALWMSILITGTLVILLFFISEMKTLIEIATILSFVTAPFYAIINYKLITSSHTPAFYRPRKAMRILSWSGILFLIGFSVWYITSITM